MTQACPQVPERTRDQLRMPGLPELERAKEIRHPVARSHLAHAGEVRARRIAIAGQRLAYRGHCHQLVVGIGQPRLRVDAPDPMVCPF